MSAEQVKAQANIFRRFPTDNPRHKQFNGKTYDAKALSLARAALRDDGKISDAEANVMVQELFDGNPNKLTDPERRSAREIVKWSPFTADTVKERFIKNLESRDRNALKSPDRVHYSQNERVRLAYQIARAAINDTSSRNGGTIGRDEAEKMADMLHSSADGKLTSKIELRREISWRRSSFPMRLNGSLKLIWSSASPTDPPSERVHGVDAVSRNGRVSVVLL